MSVFSGQRIVSIRRRVLAYCEQHNIAVPKAFLELGYLYGIVLVEICVPENRLVGETFYSAKSVLQYLKDQNKNPENYRVLDFKRGVELVFESTVNLKRGSKFDNRKNVDIQR
jgi:hypothetical protein